MSYFKVLGAAHFMKVAVPPLDSALPKGQPLQVLRVVFFMQVAVPPLDSALPTGQPIQILLKSLEGYLLQASSSTTC